MSRKPYDPLAYIPSPDVIRKKLTEAEQLASRLRVLLRVSEEIAKTGGDSDSGGANKEVSRVA
jgi:hypothetical protein